MLTRAVLLALSLGMLSAAPLVSSRLPEQLLPVSGASGGPAPAGSSARIISLSLSAARAMGGETVTGTIRQVGMASSTSQVFRLESSPPSLLKFNGEPQVALPAGQTIATFTLTIVPSSIKTAVTVSAVETTGAVGISAGGTVQIYPALIKAVTLSASSMAGTHGAAVNCTVELNAPAPSGGVDLYPFMTFSNPTTTQGQPSLTLSGATPRVQGGSRTLVIPIAYDALQASIGSVSASSIGQSGQRRTSFNDATSRIELVMAVEPQTLTSAASPVAGVASRVTLDVVPLRVVSSSSQPSSVVGGAESVGSYTLSAPPGPNEIVIFSPVNGIGSSAWARPTGVACSAGVQNEQGRGFLMQLTPGTSSQSFKICTDTPASTQNKSIFIQMRSGTFSVPITVRP